MNYYITHSQCRLDSISYIEKYGTVQFRLNICTHVIIYIELIETFVETHELHVKFDPPDE